MSQPTSPPMSPRKGKHIACKVYMLDDTTHVFHIPHKASGGVLFAEVTRKLNLLESDYFDLEYIDFEENYANEQKTCWLDHEKPVLKQVAPNNLHFKFLVKFYNPDPGLMEDEYTRYLFALQIKRDLSTGAMPCQEHTAVLLASYIVQSEIGDFSEEEYVDHSYLMNLKLLPNQTEELDVKIMEHHKEHVGQSPGEADFNLLDTARKVELYGIRMHPAKDHEGVPLHLAVAHMGVLVFQSYTKINTFSWAKIRKLSFKRKKFLIKLHPEGYVKMPPGQTQQGYYKDTVEFYFETRNECKNFWKKCIEHHAFFRCHTVKRIPRNKTRVVSRGSSFRYSGKTQKQLVEYVRDHYVKRTPFERARKRVVSTGARLTAPKRKLSNGAAKAKNGSASSTSMRTVSTMNRSMGATPISASGTLNSRDGRLDNAASAAAGGTHYSHNTSSSAGSHTLDHVSRSREDVTARGGGREPTTTMMTETVDVHNGYHHHQQQQQQQQQQHNGRNQPSAPYYENHQDMSAGQYAEHQQSIDPSKFMLSMEDRKMSAPALSSLGRQHSGPGPADDHHLSRTHEVENIPERLQHMPTIEQRSPGLLRTQSATQPDHPQHYQQQAGGPGPPPAYMTSLNMTSEEEEELPPPPPPIYQEDPNQPKPTRIIREKTSPPPRDMTLTSQSTASAASVTLTSGGGTSLGSMGSSGGQRTEESEDEDGRRKRYPADKAYYIAKELLMTERTYRKDLEVITLWFKEAVCKEGLQDEHVVGLLFNSVEPIYQFHTALLKDIETRLHMWEGKSNAHLNGEYQRIGDIMLNGMRVLQLYSTYIEVHEEILKELESTCKRNRPFEQAFKDFEGQKVCYLPLHTFLLKPAQRLLHYKLILERLQKHYSLDSPDYQDCQVALGKIVELTQAFSELIIHLENLQKLIELQRDLVGMDSLVMPHRKFIREGCLQKLSKKGYQQRMFFLFSDMLVYTSRTATPSLQFKVHGQLPLKGMVVDETDAKMGVSNSFTIYAGNRCLVLAASSEEEKDKWQEDLKLAIVMAKEKGDDGMGTGSKIQYPSLKSNSSSIGSSEALEDSHEEPRSPPTPDRQLQHRANTTMHVCWHRNTSVSMRDHNSAIENQLSGYLLRKFKNSNGWQKLWVVFTNFCLFFYKTFQEDYPLASLPLLGYSVSTPAESDGIHKDYVFKLQFKNHVYFFRAESEYTFERWIEVITSATSTSRRSRMFSRLESTPIV